MKFPEGAPIQIKGLMSQDGGGGSSGDGVVEGEKPKVSGRPANWTSIPQEAFESSDWLKSSIVLGAKQTRTKPATVRKGTNPAGNP